ncbi:MAG: Holliday junction branch migration protein RuvA [Sulfurifustaceae bacterium]
MIGRLRGTLVRKEPPTLLVEVGGVGYELEAPMTTFYDLPAVGEIVMLYTHLVVREDAHLLFGFGRESQRRQFRALLKISGVGPRVALAVLSGLTEDELVRCVSDGDLTRLTQVPGIGRKTAERLIVELRDKLTGEAAPLPPAVAGREVARDPAAEAVSALIALGYKPQEASRVVRGLPTQGQSTEELILQALRALAV